MKSSVCSSHTYSSIESITMFRPSAIFRKRNDLFVYDSSGLAQKNHVVKDETPKTGIFEVLSEFCGKSSIHGLVYLGDQKRRLIERVCWAIAIAISLSLCGFVALQYWQNHGADRIILRYTKNPIPIDSIPFPGVSICPVTKSVAKKFNYTDVYRALMKLDGENSRNVTHKEFETIKIVNQLCEFHVRENISKLFTDLFVPESMYYTILEIMPNITDTLIFCKLFDKWIDCSEIFGLSLSDAGFCFIFNIVRLTERLTDEVSFNVSQVESLKRASTWNIDDGYRNDVKHQDSYPYRAIDAGLHYSLFVILKTNDDDIDYLCGGTSQGFKIAFHSPIDKPRASKRFFELSPNRAALYSIEPRYTKTEDNVRKYSPHIRECYFNSERQLRFFRQYTRSNCLIECLANHTLAQCGCVHFTMLHANDTKICGTAKLACSEQSQKMFYGNEDINKCGCLRSCSALSYDAFASTTNFDFARTLSQTIYKDAFDLENSKFSRLIVSFKSDLITPLIRIENNSWADILSYIGGFCGLFIGASLLSIIELLYYFTIRTYFRYHNNRNPNGSQQVFPYLP